MDRVRLGFQGLLLPFPDFFFFPSVSHLPLLAGDIRRLDRRPLPLLKFVLHLLPLSLVILSALIRYGSPPRHPRSLASCRRLCAFSFSMCARSVAVSGFWVRGEGAARVMGGFWLRNPPPLFHVFFFYSFVFPFFWLVLSNSKLITKFRYRISNLTWSNFQINVISTHNYLINWETIKSRHII